jgi:hypothetical protein
MAIVQAFCTSFKQQLLEGVHDFRAVFGNTFNVALYTEYANLNSTTTTYTTAGEFVPVDSGEIIVGGYVAGGAALTNIGPTQYNLAGVCSFESVTWTGQIAARGALIYNTTPVHTYTNPACIVLDFGVTRYTSNGTFTLNFPQITDLSAIVRIN